LNTSMFAIYPLLDVVTASRLRFFGFFVFF
jgi:hypothetical protein